MLSKGTQFREPSCKVVPPHRLLVALSPLLTFFPVALDYSIVLQAGCCACFLHCIHAHVTATRLLQDAWPRATGSWCNPSIHTHVVGWEESRQTACFWLSSGSFDDPAVTHLLAKISCLTHLSSKVSCLVLSLGSN